MMNQPEIPVRPVHGDREYGRGMGWWLAQGALGGLIAGIVFALFEMLMASIMVGVDAFWMPLRMIGAILLGAGALDPAYPLFSAALAGVAVHMVFAIGFGMIFGLIVGAMPALARSTGALLAAASIFGLVLWLVNFYVIAPVMGWVWFPNETNPVVQFFAHTFFYGTVLGWYLDRAMAAQPLGDRASMVA